MWFDGLGLVLKRKKALPIATLTLAGAKARKKCAAKGKEEFYEKTVWFHYQFAR
jgi:hypothetical protein